MDSQEIERLPLHAVKIVSGGHLKNTRVYLKTTNGLVDISSNVTGVRWECDVRGVIAKCEVDMFASDIEMEADEAVTTVRTSLVPRLKAFIKSLRRVA